MRLKDIKSFLKLFSSYLSILRLLNRYHHTFGSGFQIPKKKESGFIQAMELALNYQIRWKKMLQIGTSMQIKRIKRNTMTVHIGGKHTVVAGWIRSAHPVLIQS